MKKVSMDSLPSTDAVVEELPIEDGKKEKMREYLKLLHSEYSSKIQNNLYDISLDNIKKPDFFSLKTAHDWYKYYVRNTKKRLFESFPEINNIEERPICPFCEGALSTKTTLEHVIPKNIRTGDYRLSILPINLIKCCPECNTSRHSKKSDKQENSEINLYCESYQIEKYFFVEFEQSCGKLIPKSYFKYDESIRDKRIKNFIFNYNIKETYNYRLLIEFQKILTVLSANLTVLSQTFLLIFIKYERESYLKSVECQKITDNIWIDQNYFGYKICDRLLELAKFDKLILDKLISEIKERRNKSPEIAFSNPRFFEDLIVIHDEHDLARFVCSNEIDVKNYYHHQKNNNLVFEFPNLYENDNTGKKNIIESILQYYLENNKELSNFEQICISVLN